MRIDADRSAYQIAVNTLLHEAAHVYDRQIQYRSSFGGVISP
jgi:hypothetical protein